MKGVVVRQGRAPHSSDGFVPRTFGGFVCGFLLAPLADSLNTPSELPADASMDEST